MNAHKTGEPKIEPTRLLRHAKDSIESFKRWFEDKLEPFAKAPYPLELGAWRKELGLISGLIDHPERVRIALVGTTGAGKSTFLNAVLGRQVLPVGVMEPCTAFVTAVTHSPDPLYTVTVRFCTSQEWEKDVDNLISALRTGEPGEESQGQGEFKRLVHAARKRIQAVYGVRPDDELDPARLRLPAEAERLFAAGSTETIQFRDDKEMLSHLRKLIRGESTLWPLIKQVDISGPYECLAGGLELVDLPGLNDPNEARVEVTREFLRTSPFVWVIFSMVRGLTEDIQTILREEKLLRTFVLSGTYGDALSLVGTKADQIDTNDATQMGLAEDCTIGELVRAYREQTVDKARRQLEQMIRDLASGAEGSDTLARMVDTARQVRVHTTSASAYIKLKGIAPLKKDYGLADESETGIPDIHHHLSEIAKRTGASFNAEAALKRIDQLRDEIAFFFRAKTQAPTPKLEEARSRLQNERQAFSGVIQNLQKTATDRLRLHREQFLQKVDPLLKTSVQGVRHATEEWQGIHWSTLRATVQRDGAFKSPSTGRSYDFNGDLAEPLLAQLPVSWQQYFTDDLGRVTSEFVLRATESGKNFCERVRLTIDLLFNRRDADVEDQLAWFQEKLSLLAKTAESKVFDAVRERRRELAAKMPLVAKSRMQPSYDSSKLESGGGMKRRILGQLEVTALASAQPIYSTIQTDLLEGLNDLEAGIVAMFINLSQTAEEQARIVAHNANIDVDEAAIDSVVADLLKSIPRHDTELD